MPDDIKMDLARLLRDKQAARDEALGRWVRSARSISRMMMDGAAEFGRFDAAAFRAACEDLDLATRQVGPLEDEVRELRGRLA